MIVMICVIVLILALLACLILKSCHASKTKPQDTGNLIETYYQNKSLWVAQSTEQEGAFEKGFCFMDIDLDGQKELAVQLGGGSMRNCVTNFYRIQKNEVQELTGFEVGYSLAVSHLSKYKDASGQSFYINQGTLKVGPDEYMTSYDKITSGLKAETLYAVKEFYREDGMINRDYYIGEKEASEGEYRQSFEEWMNGLQEEMITTYFVPFTKWNALSEEEQKQELKASYEVTNANYSSMIAERQLKPIDLQNYTPIQVELKDAIYGSELLAVKEAFETGISADIYTDHESFIYVMPMPDALDNMIFYYQNGKLTAYTREFMGIGGSVTYYFNHDKLISIDKTKLEPEMEFTPENTVSIIIKSESAWNEYGR